MLSQRIHVAALALFEYAQARVAGHIADPAMAARHDVIHAYRTSLTTMPPGTRVRLRTGARGVVLDAFPETPSRPLLAIVEDRSGRRLRDPIELDLRKPHDPDHEIELVLPRPDKRI